MEASLIYDLAPIGSIVSWSDETPRPPERHKKKLITWKDRNGSGRLIRKEVPRTLGNYTSPPSFTLHEGDLGSRGTILVTILRTFGTESTLSFKVLQRPPIGSVRVFDHPGTSRELVHLSANREAAEAWLKVHLYPHAMIEDVPDAEADRPQDKAV